MTDMPQMVALYNGMGGGSAAAIGAVELLRLAAERGAARTGHGQLLHCHGAGACRRRRRAARTSCWRWSAR
jgi:hypothetical protein